MIEYIRVENYRSIGEKQEMNLTATSDKSHAEIIIETNKSKILPVIPIYGGNATGKTNILKSLKTLTDIVNGDLSLEEAYDPCGFYEGKETTFELIFFKDKIKYFYKISYNDQDILEEFLYYYPKGKISKIFDRKRNNYTFGDPFESNLKTYSNDTSSHMSFLRFSYKFLKGNVEAIDKVGHFFKDDLIFLGEDLFKFTLEEIKKIFKESENQESMKTFIEYFYKHLNIGVKKIQVNNVFSDLDEATKNKIINKILNNHKVKKDISSKSNIQVKSEILKSLFTSSKETSIDLIYDVKGKEISIPIEQESTGIQKIFTFGKFIADALCNNKVVIFDELEIGFHPIIAKKIIELFSNEKTKAQLIFTTHNTNLLDLKIFRRDQIYFAKRTKETDYQSVFLSLSSIPGIRKLTDIEKAYLKGDYCDSPTLESFNIDKLFGGSLCQI